MDRADMTAPMPETMSPREKDVQERVEKIVFEKFYGGPLSGSKERLATALIAEFDLAALASSGDHAELARLAEAATSRTDGGNWKADPYGIRQIWAKSLKGGDAHIADVRGWGYLTGGGHGALGLSDDEGLEAQRQIAAFIAAANPATVLSLLSEIAALRGERDGLKNRVSCLERLGGEQSTRVMEQATRAKDAERQRDELRKALGDVLFIRKDNPKASDRWMLEEVHRISRIALANQGAD